MSQTVKHMTAAQTAAARPLTVVPDPDDWALLGAQWTRSLRARNIAESTITRYVQSYRRLATYAADAHNIHTPEDVDRETLEAFFEWALGRTTRTGRKAEPASVAIDYRHLRVFFNWLADKDDVPSPMAKLKGVKVPKKPVAIFTDDQLRALLKACAGRDFVCRRDTAIMRLLLDAGVRRAEIAGLTVGDIKVDQQLATVHGKGRKTRDVPYGTKTAEAIDDYLRARRRHPDATKTDALWLAVAPHHGALGYDGVRLMLERRARTAGVEGMFAHRFRHTAAHAFLDAGGSEGDAMRNFGWETRSMVDRYGAAAASKRAQASARRISAGDRV